MKKLLLPRWTRALGLVIIIPLLIYFFIEPEIIDREPDRFDFDFPVLFYDFVFDSKEKTLIKEVNLFNELLLSIILIASWMVAFAKLKQEDEYTWLLRLESMLLALIINLGLLFVINFMVFGMLFFHVMTFQLFIFPLIFSAVFAYRLQEQKKQSNEE